MQEVLISNFLSEYKHSWPLMVYFLGQSCFCFYSEHFLESLLWQFANPQYYIFCLLKTLKLLYLEADINIIKLLHMWTFSVTWSVCVRYIYLLHNFPLFLLFSLWKNGVKWHFENMSYTIKCFPSPLRHSRCSAIFWLLDILILLLRPGVTQPSKYTHRNERPQGVEYPLLFSHSGCGLMCWRQCLTLSLTLKM